MRLPWHVRPAYGAVLLWARLTGAFEYPIRAEGDLARMRFLDKAYWLHKAHHPVTRARRGSGLEERLAPGRGREELPLPTGFEAGGTARLIAAGDVMPHPYVGASAGSLFDRIGREVFEADVSMANLEAIVRRGHGGRIRFTNDSAPGLTLDAAELDVLTSHQGARWTFLSTANNHSLDLGADGVDRTLDALDARGIAHHGANRRGSDPREPTVVERNGIRIGIVAFTFGLNARVPPPDRPELINRMRLDAGLGSCDLTLLEAQLRAARERAIDFVVAQLHWGMEYELYPTPEQLEIGHAMAELGVDAIVGHHPHVLQPLELYRTTRDPDRVVPIAYSLGNLTNPFSAPILCRSGLLGLELAAGRTRDGSRRTYVRSARIDEVAQRADTSTGTLSLVRHPGGDER